MIKKCIGCGSKLQTKKTNSEGYIEEQLLESSSICRRCFRLKNYGEYTVTSKDNDFYEEILININKTNDLVVHVVDIFDLSNIEVVKKYVKNKSILVLTKRDLMPKSIKDNKLIDRIKIEYGEYVEIVVVSSKKNYNIDLLLSAINRHKSTNKVYIIGSTNAGKSTLINKFIKNYSDNNSYITTSYLPSTTLDTIEIKIDEDLYFIDTPGLLNTNSIINYIGFDEIKHITPKSEIHPRIYQLNKKCSILIENFCRIDYLIDKNNSFSFYIANSIDVQKINYDTNDKLRELKKVQLDINDDEDIVIEGLCFIKIVKRCKVDVFLFENVRVSKRSKLIG